MDIKEEGSIDKLTDVRNRISCPFCGCRFEFSEYEIEIVTEKIHYERGIKKILGINKGEIFHKYIACPWCHNKLKLRYAVENVEGVNVKIWK